MSNNLMLPFLRVMLVILAIFGWQHVALADLDDDVEVRSVSPTTSPTEIPKVDEKGIEGTDQSGISKEASKATGKSVTDLNSKEKGGTKKKSASDGTTKSKKANGKSAAAKTNENEKLPVVFESEGLKGTRKEGILELKKDVIVSQGDFRMDADQAEVVFDKDTEEVDHVVASGNVKISKIDPASGEKVKASSDKVTFYARKQTVTLAGNAKFSRGKDIVRGKTITYDLKSGWLNADKVEGVVQPGTENKANP